MLKLFRKDSLTPQTERIYKVPLCIQDTIPIYRISENGIFELRVRQTKTEGKRRFISLTGCICLRILTFQRRMRKKKKKQESGLKRCFGQ